MEREVEDLAALIEAVGGAAALFGVSSGGALVLEAAASGLPVRRAAVYEVPFADFLAGGAEREATYKEQLNKTLAEGRRGDAVELFLRLTGLGEEMIQGARQSPMWAGMEAVAPSLAYDDAVMGDGLLPRARLAAISVPVSWPRAGRAPSGCSGRTARSRRRCPRARTACWRVQTHMVEPEVLGPVLADFLTR